MRQHVKVEQLVAAHQLERGRASAGRMRVVRMGLRSLAVLELRVKCGGGSFRRHHIRDEQQGKNCYEGLAGQGCVFFGYQPATRKGACCSILLLDSCLPWNLLRGAARA